MKTKKSKKKVCKVGKNIHIRFLWWIFVCGSSEPSPCYVYKRGRYSWSPWYSYFLVLSVQPYNNHSSPHLKCHLIFLYYYITERERRYSNRTTSPPCRSSRISWQKKPPGRKSLWKFPVVRDLCIFWRHFGVNMSFLFHLLFKGQWISKCFFGVFDFFQKMKENKSTWGIIVVKLNSFVRFLEETSA